MSRLEKGFVIFYGVYIFVYACCFITLAVVGPTQRGFFLLLPFHIFGMVIGIPLLIIVFRDLYKRDFPNPNSKVTWTILMLMFSPSIIVYLYKHGFRPR
jgi:heme/copper-type cytochrome/quinol oxidase subunit 3